MDCRKRQRCRCRHRCTHAAGRAEAAFARDMMRCSRLVGVACVGCIIDVGVGCVLMFGRLHVRMIVLCNRCSVRHRNDRFAHDHAGCGEPLDGDHQHHQPDQKCAEGRLHWRRVHQKKYGCQVAPRRLTDAIAATQSHRLPIAAD